MYTLLYLLYYNNIHYYMLLTKAYLEIFMLHMNLLLHTNTYNY